MSDLKYQPRFNLLEDCNETMAQATKDTILLKKSRGSAEYFWPSMASIKYADTELGKPVVKVAGTCLRKSYYNSKGYLTTEVPGRGMQDIWDLGNYVEELYKQRFQSLEGYRVLFPNIIGEKLKFTNAEHKIRGEADLVLQHKETGSMFGVEMKSYVGFWAAMEIAGYDKAKEHYKSQSPYIKVSDPRRKAKPMPKIENLLQTLLYLDHFNTYTDIWKIIYISRDKGPSAEFDVEIVKYNNKNTAKVNDTIYPHITLEGIYERYDLLGEYLKKNSPPPRDYTAEYNPDEILDKVDKGLLQKWIGEKVKKGKVHRDWQCDFCPFLTTCLAEEDDHAPF